MCDNAVTGTADGSKGTLGIAAHLQARPAAAQLVHGAALESLTGT